MTIQSKSVPVPKTVAAALASQAVVTAAWVRPRLLAWHELFLAELEAAGFMRRGDRTMTRMQRGQTDDVLAVYDHIMEAGGAGERVLSASTSLVVAKDLQNLGFSRFRFELLRPMSESQGADDPGRRLVVRRFAFTGNGDGSGAQVGSPPEDLQARVHELACSTDEADVRASARAAVSHLLELLEP